MSDRSNPSASILAQLSEACKTTRSRWAAWLQLVEGSWAIILQINLGKAKQSALMEFISDRSAATWLAGTFTSGRIRSRQTGVLSGALGCQRLYVFPNLQGRCALLVGADELHKIEENLFRVLARNAPFCKENLQPRDEARNIRAGIQAPPIAALGAQEDGGAGLGQVPWLEEVAPPSWPVGKMLQGGQPYPPEEVLKNVLGMLAEAAACEAGFLAIRSGEILRVEAAWNIPEAKHGQGFSTKENAILSEIVNQRKGKILEEPDIHDGQGEPALFGVGEAGQGKRARSWMGLPIVIGQRVIGLVVFLSAQVGAFRLEDIPRMGQQVERLAYGVENAILFAQTASYLQQLALLNEMASAASLGVEPHEVARRVMDRLRRIFHTERAGVFLLSPDRKTLRRFGERPSGGDKEGDIKRNAMRMNSPRMNSPESLPPAEIPVEKSLVGRVVEVGLPYRLGDTRSAPRYLATAPGVQSELAVPLKYQGSVIGALTLESAGNNAFSQGDEQFLVMIASHLAGLFENMRLNEETRERARKLQNSVRQLQAVRETALDIGSAEENLDLDTLLQRVTHRVRELVDAQEAELGLFEDVEGTPSWEDVRRSARSQAGSASPARPAGEAIIAGRVAASGETLLVNNYQLSSKEDSSESSYLEIPPAQAGAEVAAEARWKSIAGVPLKFQGRAIGALVVMDDREEKHFWQEDIELLELLAPLVTVWIRNARLYQELQERIEAQQEAENRLIRSARLAAVGEMAAGVAHELNNPLTTVAGFVELVLEELPDESPHRADLELVLREAQRARGVVRRLLDFSRPVENQRLWTDLNELVSDVLTLVHHLVRTGGVEMHIELWDDLPPVSVDPGQVKQVLLNLVHNAIQAMPRGGRLTVKTGPAERKGQEGVTISISDSGVGIPAANLERIFEPFFTTRPAGQGTGLGLSVSYGIITEHGGSLEVESELGKGSCFTIFLPASSQMAV